MPPETIPGCPLNTTDPDRVRRVRAVLDGAGYTLDGVKSLLGPTAPTAAKPLSVRDRPRLLRLCAGDPVLGVLVRLFLLGAVVDEDEARRAASPTDLADWEALGLLGACDGGVRALAVILPADSLLIAVPDHTRAASFAGDFSTVLMSPQSATTWLLAQFLIPRPAGAALDACTGCGALGLLCAAHSRRVVFTDYNPAAARTAAFNALLNGLADFDSRQGDFFAPVEGETFDQIVCNPPFVISPRRKGDAGYEVYRDAGLPADAVSERVVRSLPRLLRPGGFAQALINWVQIRGEDDAERLRSWTAGSDCDAWVYRMNKLDPGAYVTEWITPPDDYSDAHVRPFENWVNYFEAEGVEAVGYGLITLRARPGGRNWFTCEPPPRLSGPCGEDLANAFDRRDLLENLNDEALLGLRLDVGPAVRWRQEWRREGNDCVDMAALIERTEGLAHVLRLDRNSLTVVERCRGDRPLGTVLAELAAEWGQPAAGVVPPCLRLVRMLLENGFVAPVASGDGG